MCGVCTGEIILRTADGFENSVKVKDCKVHEYRTYIMPRVTAQYFSGELPFPEAQETTYRTYKWHGREKNGSRVLEEVLPEIPKKPKRSTEVLENLMVDESINFGR